MKAYKRTSIILTLIISIILSFSISSCKSKEDIKEEKYTELLELLKSKKWYLYDKEISTWGEYNVSYDKTTMWLYFVSDNEGFVKILYRSDDSELGHSHYEDIDKFTFKISGNTVQIYGSEYVSSNPMTLTGSTLGDYVAQELTNDDFVLISNTMGENSDFAKEYISAVKKNLTATFDKENHVINIKSDLNSVFPEEDIKYLQEFDCYNRSHSLIYQNTYTYEYKGDLTAGENILCGWNCIMPEDGWEYSSCISTIKSLQSKHSKGESLNEYDFEIYKDCQSSILEISRIYDKTNVRLYVVINGVKVLIQEITDDIYYEPIYDAVTCPCCEGDGKTIAYSKGQEVNLKCPLCLGAKNILQEYSHPKPISMIIRSQPISGWENGHALVDLGLSVKWATMNIAASSPSCYGDYFAWGETQTKDDFDWNNYKYGTKKHLTKYCTYNSYGTVDNKSILEKSDDAASVIWGGNWRMPLKEEWTELFSACDWIWSIVDGVRGFVVLADNGNFIFLPAADKWYLGEEGTYWSSSLNTKVSSISGNQEAYSLLFHRNNIKADYNLHSRCYSGSIRAVCQ